MAGKKHKVQGLRRRWLTGSMGPVLVILLLVGVLIWVFDWVVKMVVEALLNLF